MILANSGIVATIIVGIVLVVIFAFAIVSIVRNKGKCSGGCGSCPYSSTCHKNGNNNKN